MKLRLSAICLVLLFALAGCGGGGDSSDGSNGADTTQDLTPAANGDTVIWGGREWQQSDNGNKYIYNSAIDYCANLVLDGKGDWHLPTKDELKSLVVCSDGTPTPLADFTSACSGGGSGCPTITCSGAPTIDSSFSSQSSIYWSSSISGEGLAYYVNFYDGLTRWPNIGGRGYYVRCVR